MPKINFKVPFHLFFLFFLPGIRIPLLAQDQEQITIFGSFGKERENCTAPVEVITQEEIRRFGCKNAAEALALVQGNLINSTGNRTEINSLYSWKKILSGCPFNQRATTHQPHWYRWNRFFQNLPFYD